jgi:alpha-galactosidase
MPKIVLLGAGSHVFSRHLITDIVSYPDLRDCTISLMDVAQEPLDLITAFARKLVQQHGFNTKIESTTNRRQALAGADYVIVAIRVGGNEATRPEKDIPLKYGIHQAIADTTGPGGVFYASRHVPAILDICQDMQELCPNAWLLNYTNPMAIISWAVSDYTKIKNVGLCHSVPNTAAELARYIGVPYSEISYWVAGINHMAWFLEYKWKGQDAYPLIREKFKDPALYSAPDAHWAGSDVVRAEIFKAFGYFVTESSRHMSEYVPYFRKRPELIEQFLLTDVGRFTREGREKERIDQDAEIRQLLISDKEMPVKHSGEYGSIIIHSLETGSPARFNGNVKNTGLITNLPEGCCVEVPCLVDKEGIHPCFIGDLPPQLAALNRTEINVHELAVRGIVEKDKTKLFQAILLDPLTGALLTIAETRQMVDEIFEAEKDYLQGYK